MPQTPKNAAKPDASPSDKAEVDAICGLLFEHNPQPMWMYDATTLRMRRVNEAALKKYGYSRAGFLALQAGDLRGEQGAAIDVEELTFEGAPAPLVLVKDVAAKRLEGDHEIFAAVVGSTSNAIIGVNQEGLIYLFNPAAERIFGTTCAAMTGQALERLMPERYRADHPRHRHLFADEKGGSRMMGMGLVKGLRSDGVELDLEVTIAHVKLKAQQMQIAILKDVTDRVRANTLVEQSRAQLSELTQKLMTQEKMLVKRLAQTLHDQLGQTLAAVRMAHETIIALQGNTATPAINRLQKQLGLLVGQSIRQVRQVLVDLRPPLLDEQGLAAALDNELRNRSLSQPKMDISIHVPPDLALMRWPTEVEYAAFMVAREAVENALRHSGASLVSVTLSGSPTSLTMKVLDNGSGLEKGDMTKTGHLGMLGMQERANAIAANVTVDSDDQRGTCITFSWQPF
jgi:PAS domain S-box-containing protein